MASLDFGWRPAPRQCVPGNRQGRSLGSRRGRRRRIVGRLQGCCPGATVRAEREGTAAAWVARSETAVAIGQAHFSTATNAVISRSWCTQDRFNPRSRNCRARRDMVLVTARQFGESSPILHGGLDMIRKLMLILFGGVIVLAATAVLRVSQSNDRRLDAADVLEAADSGQPSRTSGNALDSADEDAFDETPLLRARTKVPVAQRPSATLRQRFRRTLATERAKAHER